MRKKGGGDTQTKPVPGEITTRADTPQTLMKCLLNCRHWGHNEEHIATVASQGAQSLPVSDTECRRLPAVTREGPWTTGPGTSDPPCGASVDDEQLDLVVLTHPGRQRALECPHDLVTSNSLKCDQDTDSALLPSE